jgi:hypothetical protein
MLFLFFFFGLRFFFVAAGVGTPSALVSALSSGSWTTAVSILHVRYLEGVLVPILSGSVAYPKLVLRRL